MLVKPNDSGDASVAMSHSMGELMDRHAQRALPSDSYDALYPVDHSTPNLGAEEDWMSVLWGDVSIGARHPSRITA